MKEQNKPQGDRFNQTKSKWSYVRFSALKPLTDVLEFGATKYKPFNYTKGLSQVEICESLLRHIIAYMEGANNDNESQLNILGHIQANAYFLEYNRLHHPELDDRFIEDVHKNKGCNNDITGGVINALQESLIGEERNNDVSINCEEEEPKDTYLDIQCDKYSLNNNFNKLLGVILNRHVSSDVKQLEIARLIKRRDNELNELSKRINKDNSKPKELSADEIIAMAKNNKERQKVNYAKNHKGIDLSPYERE